MTACQASPGGIDFALLEVVTNKSAAERPLELRLVDDPAPARALSVHVDDGSTAAAKPAVSASLGIVSVDVSNEAPAVAKLPVTAGMTSADRFLTEAIREYEAGRIDQPLWARAVVQAEGDETRTIAAYLRARSTALQVIKRDKRQERSDRRVRALHAAHGVEQGKAKPADRKRTVIAAMLGGLVVVGGMLGTFWASNSTQQATVSAPASSAARSEPAKRSEKASNNAAVSVKDEDPSREFRTRIQELKDAGNWNVVVLIASAWTRKEPGNAAAWNELSMGYVNMRQFDDAYGAAKKAVQLAPKDALLWRNLGRLGLDMNEPVEALRAFDEAALLNDKDAYSFVQAGILNARLDRLPEAKLAFDKARALNPDDVDARCGEALIARKQARTRSKDPNATARQAELSDGKCRDLFEQASVAVVLKDGTTFKVVPAGGR